MESAGEHLAVVGQNLLRNPKGLQRRAQPEITALAYDVSATA
jgi:hypothetical protein